MKVNVVRNDILIKFLGERVSSTRTALNLKPYRIVETFFAISKNVVHNLNPDMMPRNSVSHQAPNCAQRS